MHPTAQKSGAIRHSSEKQLSAAFAVKKFKKAALESDIVLRTKTQSSFDREFIEIGVDKIGIASVPPLSRFLGPNPHMRKALLEYIVHPAFERGSPDLGAYGTSVNGGGEGDVWECRRLFRGEGI